ncbi:unnamed protein product [Closterium sp. NIES-64]|nr:unnamed protein product [Closterium sp. NIES-64]
MYILAAPVLRHLLGAAAGRVALDELPLNPDAPSRPASSPLNATGLPPSSNELPLDPDAPSCPATSALNATGLPPSSDELPLDPDAPSCPANFALDATGLPPSSNARRASLGPRRPLLPRDLCS